MKIMSREFTRAEKVLLLILALILVGLAYYYFVDQPVRKAIASQEAEAKELQVELKAAEERLAYLKDVQSDLTGLEESGNLSWMGSYNNSKEEVAFLNDALDGTMEYTINFANVTRNGDQIRRSFTLQYRTQGYAAAKNIMTQLCQGKNRCIVGDVRCSIDKDSVVTVNAAATFYETMVGGVPDAALPADSAASKR